ncbi:hypothetical protein EST38_g14360 [Candolleomyces aberdarensis]|uniref:Uncharacterized protein n=1 Tax=Candolleomyces aberdarensis TaxID=2316362 RepID=A0A4Q2D058_9AGAR|nr:hypothetical protein EST38_g14360 [Candolleomyces aberdarensis]
MDIGNDSSLSPHRARKHTTLLVDCIKRNPKLATYVKDLDLTLSSNVITEDPCLPELLDQLSCISVFRFSSTTDDYSLSTSWESLSPELRAATAKICALSTIRMLYLASFTEIPLCLIENPYLSNLSVGNIRAFSDLDRLRLPATLPVQDTSNPSEHASSAPSERRFPSLRTLVCGYIGGMPTDWIPAMVENPTLSTSLRSLNLMFLFEKEAAKSSADILAQFNSSFNLSGLRESAELTVIKSLFKYTNNLISTVSTSAPLEELYITIGDLTHQPLTTQLLSDEWKQLVTTITSRRPTLKTVKVKFRFGPCDKKLELEPFVFRTMDIGNDSSLPPHRARKYTTAFVDCIKRNPKLATYVKDLELNVSSNVTAEDPCLPELLDQLSCISVFRFSSTTDDYSLSTSWESLSPELRAATAKICALSTIRMLHIASFTELPLCLLENPYLSNLSIGHVRAFSDLDRLRLPATLPVQDTSNPSKYSFSAPSERRFTSLNTLVCLYIGSMPTDWIRAMMETPALSTSLRNFSLLFLFDETAANSSADILAQFNPSFNLSDLRVLRYLKIYCLVDLLLPQSAAQTVIKSLFKYANNLISTVNTSAPLEELYITIGDLMHQPLTTQLLSDEWKQLVTTIASRRPTIKTIKVKLRFGPCDKKLELEVFNTIQEIVSNDMSGILLVLKSADRSKVERIT